MRTKNINTKLTRWSLFLQDFNFEIRHTKGTDNTLCDYLSRYPNKDTTNIYEDELFEKFEPIIDNEFNPLFFEEFVSEDLPNANLFIVDTLLIDLNDISRLQREDKYYKHIIDILEGKIKGKNKSLRKAAANYELKNNKLYRVIVSQGEFKNVLAIPQCLVSNILHAMHDNIISGGHTGIRKTFERCRLRFHWRSIYSDVIKYVLSCITCQQTKNTHTKAGTLKPVSPGSRPFSKLAIDLMGLLPTTKRGNRYIVVATCYLTKYTITKALKNITAADIAKFILHNVILKFSVFDELITDNGLQFRSELLHELNVLIGAKHNFTTVYNPSSNGLVERTNKQLIQLIKTYIEKDVSKWDEVLPYITYVFNTFFHSSTKFSPFYLVFGFHPKQPIDLLMENESDELFNYSLIADTAENIRKAREVAKQNIQHSQNRYKLNFDAKRKEFEYNIGDKCLVDIYAIRPNMSHKFKKQFIGPFTVVHKINKHVYELEADDGSFYIEKIHINKMKPLKLRDVSKNTQTTSPMNVKERCSRERRLPKYLQDYYLG
ncbi:pol polyprotein-like protein [Leptotrombidium deliense]|uniref:RNA-directed DNA polymerase n=1 Tax=Leptotrombidium deliense TaxID=299467 RepID=A0A443S9C5_9ACAR|nr:pol polyprotein-like protein [Leptotrombidium deliense]